MTELPKITIITPSLNQGQFIQQTIHSVLSQGYSNLEYIVMDGGSTDGTIDILRQYDRSLYWISEKDSGQSEAINKGMRMATGEVIGFLNSDDLYEPGALWKIGRYFQQHPDAVWVTGYCRNINSEGEEIRPLIALYKKVWLLVNSASVLKILNYISQPATFWRRKILEDVGFLDPDLHYAMEYDYWLRLRSRFPLSILKDTLASFRIHPNSKAGSSANAQFDSEYLIACRHVGSRPLLALHFLHRILVVSCYRVLFSQPFRKPNLQNNYNKG